MSYTHRPGTGRHLRLRKSITTLAVAALISGGFISAPAAVATSDTSSDPIFRVSAVSEPVISGSVIAGSTVRVQVGDLSQAGEWDVGWYLDGVWADDESGSYDEFAFSIPMDAVGKRLTFEGWIWWEDERQDIAIDAGTVQGKSFVEAPIPSFTGRPAVGDALTAQPGSWSPKGASFKFQWLRNGQPINGATKSSYAPSAADLNQSVAVKVTASKVGYTSVSKTSAARKIAAGSLKPVKAVESAGQRNTLPH